MKKYSKYYEILKAELIPAYGCTEPGSLAYAGAYASKILGEEPDFVEVWCSSSVIKNVNSVSIPNADTLKGARAAVILGILLSNPNEALCILKDVDTRVLKRAEQLYEQGFCNVNLAEEKYGLYIRVSVRKKQNSAEVTIENKHTNVTCVRHNGTIIFEKNSLSSNIEYKYNLTLADILDFADNCNLSIVEPILKKQIVYNSEIAEEGLKNSYGVCIGKSLLDCYGDKDLRILACAKTSAASDARMDGCVMPVVINSGSGNQGLTVSIPVVVYANALNCTTERTLRALCVSNLVAIMQKKKVGNLSAFCGAVHAAAGAGAGISYLLSGDIKEMEYIISYTLGTIGGMICDGAKASCASKISEALDTALMGLELAHKGKHLMSGDGLIGKTLESTIDNFGIVGKEGMRDTNKIILNLMLSSTK